MKKVLFALATALALVIAPAPAMAEPSAPVSAPAAGIAAKVTPDCAAYAYRGSGVSVCATHPGSAKRNCTQIGHPVRVRIAGVDPWRLDADDDGTGCDKSNFPEHVAPSPAPSSSSPSVRPSKSVRPDGPTPSTTAARPGAGPTLPLTGPGAPVYVAVGVGALVTGALLWAAARRRRNRFVA